MAKPDALVMICQHIYNVRWQVMQRGGRRGSRWSDNVYILLFLVSLAHSHAAQWLLFFCPALLLFFFSFFHMKSTRSGAKKKEIKNPKISTGTIIAKKKHRRIWEKVRFACVCMLWLAIVLVPFVLMYFCFSKYKKKSNLMTTGYFSFRSFLSRRVCISLKRFWELRGLFFSRLVKNLTSWLFFDCIQPHGKS